MNKVLLLGMFLLFAVVVSAENQTITMSQTLTIVCNNETQCATAVNGSPILFFGNGTTTEIAIPFTFTYDQNVTIIQNVSIIQNVTTLNITTQNITVVDCNQTPMNFSQADLQANIISALSQNLTASCTTACAVADHERQNLTGSLLVCESERNNIQVECNSKSISDGSRWQAELNISRQETDQARETNTPWMLLALGAIVVCAAVLIVEWHKSKPQKVPAGSMARPIPEELLELSDDEDVPPSPPPRRKAR